ncbi:hypothetical protein NW768_008253 [Fusarium equiseti]|uniref:F-box domain-containing protein n=1 Tax=Fusarium equiseti TaxID=61235 RepID=A0ABQ8R6I2_FUSEQ|nr:hypothetical protein NW768_008253 [Fusarium equiseti]
MRRFKVKPQTPQVPPSFTQRLVNYFRSRKSTYHISVLRANEGKFPHLDTPVPEDASLPVSHLDAPVPEDAGLPEPLKPKKSESRKNLESGLLQLPPELLIYAMCFLPHSSLYMVRQTCQVLRNLADDFQFDDFHWEIFHHEEPRCFITMPLCEELRLIKRIFLRRSLCKPCLRLFDSGELKARLGELWQPVHCKGCQVSHPELLFPQGGRKHDICVGLLGEFALCKHVNVTGEIEVHNGKNPHFRCLDPEHSPENSMDYEERSAFQRYRPLVQNVSAFDGCVVYSRSFPLVKIAPQQYPGMPALKSRLLKQLKEIQHDGLCQHASTQLESIVLSLPSDKCECFPASGPPVHEPKLAGRDLYRCENHDYDCRHGGALYYWFFENNYVVLKVTIDLATNGADGMNWLANITFPIDQHPIHPILNEKTKGVLWCGDSSCGTGCGNRWLLMVEIMKGLSYREEGGSFGLPRRDRLWAANLPYTLEYQVFQSAADWMTEPNMLRMDLLVPRTTKFDT